MNFLLLLTLPSLTAAKCLLTRPTQFMNCYTVIPQTSPFWLYAIIFCTIFLATLLGIKIYTCLRLGWLHPPDDLPKSPPPAFQPPLPPPIPLTRAPSVVSYFHFVSAEENV